MVKKKIIYALIETGHTFTLRHPQIWNDVFARFGETVLSECGYLPHDGKDLTPRRFAPAFQVSWAGGLWLLR